MTAQLNISALAHFLPNILTRVRRFLTPDFIVLPALGFLWIIMLWSMLSTFLTTLMPSPCLPTIVNTAIGVSKVSKEYLELAQVLWNSPDGDPDSFSIPQVPSKISNTVAFI